MTTFETRGQRDETGVRVHVRGELDLATVPLLAACVREHVHDLTGPALLDLREVGFIDSTGVHLLLTLQTEAAAAGWTLTILASDAVDRIFGLLGLRDRLTARSTQAVEPPQPQRSVAA